MSASGSCNCGAIKVTVTNPPDATVVCHCLGCRTHGGVGGSIMYAVPDAQVSVEGSTKVYEDKGDSGKPVHRHFCGTCATPIMSRVEAMPGTTFVKLNGFTSFPKPSASIYTRNKQSWEPSVEGVTGFEGAPPSS